MISDMTSRLLKRLFKKQGFRYHTFVSNLFRCRTVGDIKYFLPKPKLPIFSIFFAESVKLPRYSSQPAHLRHQYSPLAPLQRKN